MNDWAVAGLIAGMYLLGRYHGWLSARLSPPVTRLMDRLTARR